MVGSDTPICNEEADFWITLRYREVVTSAEGCQESALVFEEIIVHEYRCPVWRTADGGWIPIVRMGDRHLKHTIRFLERKIIRLEGLIADTPDFVTTSRRPCPWAYPPPRGEMAEIEFYNACMVWDECGADEWYIANREYRRRTFLLKESRKWLSIMRTEKKRRR